MIIKRITAAILIVLTSTSADAETHKGPPLEVYLPTMSEDGQSYLTVRYHADGTFEMAVTPATGRWALYSNSARPNANAPYTGRWWWEGNTFCFMLDRGSQAGKIQRKTNGHLIGRTPAE